MKPIFLYLAIGLLGLSLTGCKSTDSNTTNTVTITGHVGAAGVSGATVSGAGASAVTDAEGNYSLAIPETALSSSLLFSTTGGSYTDEVSGQQVFLGSTQGFSAMVPANALSATATEVNLNAGTTLNYLGAVTMVQYHAAHGHTHTLDDTFEDLATYYATAFGYTPDHTVKAVSAAATPASTDSEAQKLEGLREAAFSQLAKDVLGDSRLKISLLSAIADDLADGSLDGKGNGSTLSVANQTLPTSIQNRWETALLTYMASSANLSALTPAQIGGLPFGKTATSSNYLVTYTPGTMAAMQGLTTFDLAVTDLSGNAVSGASIGLTLLMNMASMSHSTPQEGCSLKSGSTNIFTCRVYYLMAGGAGMGYWKLTAKVSKSGASDESVVFYPAVGMAMTDTTRATLRSTVLYSAASTKRYYYLFKDSVTTDKVSLFLVTQESMMSFPALKTGTKYNSGGAYALTPSSITVEYSKDKTTWSAMASASNDGHYSATGMGLTSGTAATLYVRVLLDGDGSVYATSDGTTTGTAYATLTLTPSSM